MQSKFSKIALVAAVLLIMVTACAPKTSVKITEALTIGMVLVGPHNDTGWSQATYEGAQYTSEHIAGSQVIYIENAYSGSDVLKGTTTAGLAEQLVAQGANLIIFNSDDMKDDSTTFAQAHPDVPVIMLSGDQEWEDGNDYVAIPNMVNIMGRMEYMKMIAGCTAALTTQTGKIGFLGPLVNAETQRLAASAFLGAKYCWTTVLGNDAADLNFTVTWIGYWLNIPGLTLDPTQVADDFFNNGFDVVISGIDTTEALSEAVRYQGNGEAVWAIPYDYSGACAGGPEVCLGVPYFNWGPAILETVQSAVDGNWVSNFQWNAPDWTNINNPDTGAVGFNKGDALSADNTAKLDAFIAELAGGLNLWEGPINLQDGSVYLADGVAATDQQIWYLPSLLEGMVGQGIPNAFAQ